MISSNCKRANRCRRLHHGRERRCRIRFWTVIPSPDQRWNTVLEVNFLLDSIRVETTIPPHSSFCLTRQIDSIQPAVCVIPHQDVTPQAALGIAIASHLWNETNDVKPRLLCACKSSYITSTPQKIPSDPYILVTCMS